MNLLRIISTFLKGYKPEDYWYERGKVYQKEFKSSQSQLHTVQEKMLIDYLKSLSFETVLEFGCGFGRITKLMLENFSIKKYTAFDLSSHQINNAKKFCENFNNVWFVQTTIQDFEPEEKYDLVLGVEVLLHVLPNDIHNVLNKLVSLSNYHLIHMDFNSNYHPKILLPHNFVHQYKKTYENVDKVCEIIEKPLTRKTSLFHAKIA